MSKKIAIGTRGSKLAVWQAQYVQRLIESTGVKTELVYIKSEGDDNLISPLYEMGVQGIFTKALDTALLNKQIDIAVHSLKDVPTQLPAGIVLTAVPERGDHRDALVYKDATPDAAVPYTVATSSLRRKAQWLHRYPAHSTDALRGNIHTRLEKLRQTPHWNGALFALAGIQRVELPVPNMLLLDWMLPAPAQGALGIACREEDLELRHLCKNFNDEPTQFAVNAERAFLRRLMGGCSMPIAAYAFLQDNKLIFHGNVLTIDGVQKAEVQMEFYQEDFADAGNRAADQLMKDGGEAILDTFKKSEGK